MADLDVLKNLNFENSALLNGTIQKEQVVSIKLTDIEALAQVRSESNAGFEEHDLGSDDDNAAQSLTALALSIRQRGLQNPIIVRQAHVDNDFSKPVIDSHFIVVSGERRYRATKLIQQWQEAEKANGTFNNQEPFIDSITCIVREYKDESSVILDQLTENIQRAELDPFEIALSLKKIKDAYAKQHPDELSPITGEMPKEKLAEICGKPRFWLTQMESFAELDALKDGKLIEFFTNGTISKSPRAGYELIRLYRKAPEKVLEFLEEYHTNQVVVDRRRIQDMNDLIEMKIKREESDDDNFEMPNLILSSMRDPNEDNTQKPVSNITDDGEDFEEPDFEDTASDNGNSSYDENEYPDHEEREKSGAPKMFSKHQESTAPTAGVNATSSYTDRDTRTSHDLSDRIREDDRQSYDVDDVDGDIDEDDSVELSFNNDEGLTVKGRVSASELEQTTVNLVTDDGQWIKVSIKQLLQL